MDFKRDRWSDSSRFRLKKEAWIDIKLTWLWGMTSMAMNPIKPYSNHISCWVIRSTTLWNLNHPSNELFTHPEVWTESVDLLRNQITIIQTVNFPTGCVSALRNLYQQINFRKTVNENQRRVSRKLSNYNFICWP